MSDLLSSDILEAQFGPTELAVLYQDETSRIIATRAKDGGQLLELSFVNFNRAGAAQFPEVHRVVIAGQSMGKAFREAGLDFKRQEQLIDNPGLAARFGQQFGSTDAATVMTVSIRVGPDQTPYAEILEIYSPAVRWPAL